MSDLAKRIEEETGAMADVLFQAAKDFYGQGFKTDRRYWLALAEAALRHSSKGE